MLITGLSLIAFGAVLFVVGWYLNTNTPVQQPLPVVGLGISFVGLVLTLLAL